MKSLPYFNRELSWLDFNQRIIALANSPDTPLLERLKFLSISHSNLDEFYMVRIGGLQQCTLDRDNLSNDPSGLDYATQLAACATRLAHMHQEQDISHTAIMAALQSYGIVHADTAELDEASRTHLETVFETEVFPILSPMALVDSKDFSLIFNRHLHVGVRLTNESKKTTQKIRFAVLPITRNIPRFILLPSRTNYQFVLIEEVVEMFAARFFPGEEIIETACFRIMRNADLAVREDEACDLLSEMEEVINARKHGHFVCLQTTATMSKTIREFLMRSMNIKPSFVFELQSPIDGSAFMHVANLSGYDALRYAPWAPCKTVFIPAGKSIFTRLATENILLYHPFESFDPVVKLISDAADDPDVVAIKQILYRTSSDSAIVAALMRAARAGKNVTAIVELKARFDEARNIEWARELEDSGVHVLYGVKRFKTHAKICLVVRREATGIMRYIHFGTGNYNENTAKLYCDASFLTADPDLGADATAFFNAITGFSQPQPFRKVEAAPLGLRQSIVDLIENEIEHKKQGHAAYIRAKMNSLVDPQIIASLYKASKAGVTISLNIRGICCLVPGVPKISEKITVISIVDRFLEHARIFHFCNGGAEKVFISTADWMPRNLDKRVELFVPIEDTVSAKKLTSLLDKYFLENRNAWKLSEKKGWQRGQLALKKAGANAQEAIYKETLMQMKAHHEHQPTVFEPHTALS